MDATEVMRGLWIGSQPTGPQDTAPFDAVVNLSGGFCDESKPYILWPILDGPIPDLAILHGITSAIAAWVRVEKRVLVHCGAGINRSAFVVGFALTQLGHTGADAIALIRKVRPQALSNAAFYQWLEGVR